METINLHLDNFEGPFDLLLSLIKKNKMEIMDVRLFEITEQYMDVLRAMEELDLEIATEFLVVAATLIEMKSRELLPGKKEEEEEVLSEEALRLRLEAYQFFKERGEELNGIYGRGNIMVTRLPMTIPEEKTVELIIPENFGPKEFFELYLELLDRQSAKINRVTMIDREIPVDEFKVEDKILELSQRLDKEQYLSFHEVMASATSRSETIVFFLAVLEMARNFEIRLSQTDPTQDLIIERRPEEWDI